MKHKLFSETKFNGMTVQNRVAMAPLTRSRSAQPGNIPQAMNVEYYRQRASAAFIITEATQISQQGQGYAFTPGIHSEQQIQGWKKVTEAVHQEGGKIILQLWHVGRISHPSFQANNQLPVAPSAIKPKDSMAFTEQGFEPIPTPQALTIEGINTIVEDYRQAAKNALTAGFDGVEIHAANGYLIDQFLHDGSNQRDDGYGGSIDNRLRFLTEVTEAVLSVWPKRQVGVRLTPMGTFADMHDSNEEALFSRVVEKLNAYDLGYMHFVNPTVKGNQTLEVVDPAGIALMQKLLALCNTTTILAGAIDRETAIEWVENDKVDFIAFGRWFIANPDLPYRLQYDLELNTPDPDTFFGGDEAGYIDYPASDSTAVA